MEKQTAIYCRTFISDPAGIEKQREALERLAGEKAFGHLAVYEDDGFSVRDRNRSAFAQLEQDLRDGKIARLLVTSVTLLGRNITEVQRWVKENVPEIHIARREPS
jgi:DNA invertase Pin-like site-specific DNA recombinase